MICSILRIYTIETIYKTSMISLKNNFIFYNLKTFQQ